MYGDFSRLTYSRAKEYSALWSQQGRVQLDADANAQTAVVLDWLRTLAIDFIGPFGGHVTNAGFMVTAANNDLTFKPGHYYINGLRCEVPGGGATTYHGLLPSADPLPTPPYLVSLLVWERSVSSAAAPDLLEPALGPFPPDTTVRSQVAWLPLISTNVLPVDKSPAITLPLDRQQLNRDYNDYNDRVNSRPHATPGAPVRPRLTARVDNQVVNEQASIVPATSGYLGVENQLYRVEIHRGGVAGDGAHNATFKWSRDNGSVEFRVVDIESETKGKEPVVRAALASLGRDERASLDVGDWVELVDDATRPDGEPPPLFDVRAVDRATLSVTLGGELERHVADHPFLRRWDQSPSASDGADGIAIAAPPDDQTWYELEDGVQVAFQPGNAQYYRGDFWLIPARTATGGVLWPGGADPVAAPPHGPDRYLAPLALVNADGTVEDLRSLFTNLAWPG